MAEDEAPGLVPDLPKGVPGGQIMRAGLNLASAIPGVGGVLAAAAGIWSEREQDRLNEFFHHWLRMHGALYEEQQKTILEIGARLDMKDEDVAKRVESPEYKAILRKAFRDWGGAESEAKRVYIRNILSNAAASRLTSDDVVKLFLDWIKNYSEFHFAVVGAIYNSAGITRGEVWRKLGRAPVREDSSDADLFKLLFRDLSTGGIIRQHRETDYAGNFLSKRPQRSTPTPKGMAKPMKSAFDDDDQYELTALGQQFVHYAMNELAPKLEFTRATENEATEV